MGDYRQEMRYVQAYLGDEEIQRRIGELRPSQLIKALARWEGGPMKINDLFAWAAFAKLVDAWNADGYEIYRLQTPEELRETVLQDEWSYRTHTTRDMPADLSDPEAAARAYILMQAAESADCVDGVK